MLDTIHGSPFIFQAFYGYDVDDEQTFDQSMTKLEKMRLVCSRIRNAIDNSSFWQLFAQKCNLIRPISTRNGFYKLVLNYRNYGTKYPGIVRDEFFNAHFFDKSIKSPPTLAVLKQFEEHQFATREYARKSDLQVLWATLQKKYNIKGIDLIRSHCEKEFGDPSIPSKQKAKEFKEWLDEHPEIYNIEELKIDKYVHDLKQIPREILYLPNLKVLDFTSCSNLCSVSIKIRKLKNLEQISFGMNLFGANKNPQEICEAMRKKYLSEGINKNIGYQHRSWGENATIYITSEVSALGKHSLEDQSESSPKKRHHPIT